MTSLSRSNPLSHSVPRFDSYGRQTLSLTPVVDPGLRLPEGWSLEPSSKTRTQMLEERRLAALPHTSYDLDRDGKVSSQDLVMAKLFDKDKDGRLNTPERRAADEAVRGGLAEKFVWGVEQSAPNRSYRIMQKRGVIVDQEDFSPVRSTYPGPQSPGGRTLPQVLEERKKARLETLEQQKQQWEAAHPVVQQFEFKEYPQSPPRFATQTEKIDLEAKQARLRAGLAPFASIYAERQVPGLGRVSEPKYFSRTHMQRERKREMLKDLHRTENYAYETGDQRLAKREERQVTILPPDVKNRTNTDIKEGMRRSANEYNLQTFSNVVVGIHGKELPKYENVEYWKLRPGYVEQPRVSSQVQLVQEQRFWAPKDHFRLADMSDSPPEPDPFKAVHVLPEVKEEELPEKPNNHLPRPYRHWDLDDPSRPPPVKHEYRWTTIMHMFTKGSVFAPLKDPDIVNVDTVTPEERREVKVNTTTASSDLAGTMHSGGSLGKKSGVSPAKKLMKQGLTLVRSTGFLEKPKT